MAVLNGTWSGGGGGVEYLFVSYKHQGRYGNKLHPICQMIVLIFFHHQFATYQAQDADSQIPQ